MDKTTEEYNDELQQYYDSIREGVGLKYIVKFKEMGDIDTIDALLDDLKGKTITMDMPDKKEEDEAALWMKQRLEEQRELERKGKKKIKW